MHMRASWPQCLPKFAHTKGTCKCGKYRWQQYPCLQYGWWHIYNPFKCAANILCRRQQTLLCICVQHREFMFMWVSELHWSSTTNQCLFGRTYLTYAGAGNYHLNICVSNTKYNNIYIYMNMIVIYDAISI